MDLVVKNLGPIRDLRLPIRPLTVLIGKNHSGKTTLAYALYAAIKGHPYAGIEAPPPGDATFGAMTARLRGDDRVHLGLAEFFQDSSGLYGGGEVNLDISEAEFSACVARVLGLDEVPSPSTPVHPPPTKQGKRAARWSYSRWTDLAFRVWHAAAPSSAFALPAERNALVLTYKMMANRRLRLLRDQTRRRLGQRVREPLSVEGQDRFLRELGEPRFSQPIEDFLDFLADAELYAGAQGKASVPPDALEPTRRAIADKLEAALLGEQRLLWAPTGLGGSELVLKIDGEHQLDLHLASSALKQIAPLLLWLRLPRTGDLLIIDEPELNLHPIAQAKVLEALALLVRCGIRVLITTHSASIMAHLNNLLAGHMEDATIRSRQADLLYLHDSGAFLRPEEVGAFELEDGKLSDLYEPGWGVRWDTLSEGTEALTELYFRIGALAGGLDEDG